MQNYLDRIFPRAAPRQVSVSLGFLWAMLVISFVFQMMPPSKGSSEGLRLTFPPVSALLSDLGMAFLLLKIAEGRRWARNVMIFCAAMLLAGVAIIFRTAAEIGDLRLKFSMCVFAVEVLATAVLMHVPKSFWKQRS